ncbi:aminomethyl-transferring glycine dehydrogenase [Jiulongibacter sediminis]|uniref:Glycine dehydrogenase (decarboxylating) n=1 Tax=Jiulongibacter sediminis TaxID=1605367 RepID=A0A0P7C4P7_9BACT|nr:aminomethyl-transferring glycine dehydrogenase [Jiulongibacter sediminis]KPM46895.1 glycine dehydrogenase [Jiulongibacter sediminis]TBX22245.1 glycine dehydrogenase [Jiulongibacter sediminis]
MILDLTAREKFEERHHGKRESNLKAMLQTVSANDIDQLINETVPAGIRLKNKLNLPEALTENEFLNEFRKLADQNKVFKSFIGLGYYETRLPSVILRNILENPAWYTAYTPYQAEIAQGRLEMLFNFQTMISELTGMELANASLLDEGTAAAEAMSMFYGSRKGAKKKTAETFLVSDQCFAQTIDIVIGRANSFGIQVKVVSEEEIEFSEDVFGILLQNPGKDGHIKDYSELISEAKSSDVQVAVAADLMSLVLFKPAGEMGADAVLGTTQRFGVPMGLGGPHAAFFATREEYKRQLPGRIIGLSKDAEGNDAYRMALQTREQHIRREKATSNICTSQVLLAVISAAYGLYHGPAGLKRIAGRIHGLTRFFANSVQGLDFQVNHHDFFDTVSVNVPDAEQLAKIAHGKEINIRVVDHDTVCVSFDENKTLDDVAELLEIFAEARGERVLMNLKGEVEAEFPMGLKRESDFMTHPVFSIHHTEHEMLRYLKSLENKDLSLVHSMISLGSCTMKLNATTEMMPITWPEFANLHPFAPADQTEGYHLLFKNLQNWLGEITGFDAVSLQPNSGAQGEYAGLMVIRAYHESRGDSQRNVALIPSSAHGTNPASAVMAGMKVVVTACDEFGNIDIDDLRAKAKQYADELSCLMVTYPSTHGVFEEGIRDICNLIHDFGGRVYMDGANMNAQVGLTSPAAIGADVCHLNLHKTFCIPHGGGGPGMGPIGVVKDLAPFLPGHVEMKNKKHVEPGSDSYSFGSIHAISAAPWGSAGILPISYAYIAMMGADGLTNATKNAILNANYIKSRLGGEFKILYSGANGRCAHEMIVDCREFKTSAGVEVEDIAKRLIDYGFHSPTVSFPVAGTLMIEPTESESKEELDRFCDALIAIRGEIREIEEGKAEKENNVLVNAPHSMRVVLSSEWDRPYSREKAAFPLEHLRFNKFWPAVSRIDSAYGDRNLVCACLPTEAYAEA